jgi:hypothetical protein
MWLRFSDRRTHASPTETSNVHNSRFRGPLTELFLSKSAAPFLIAVQLTSCERRFDIRYFGRVMLPLPRKAVHRVMPAILAPVRPWSTAGAASFREFRRAGGIQRIAPTE